MGFSGCRSVPSAVEIKKAQRCNQGFDLCNAIEEKLYCAIYNNESTIYLLAVAELEHQHL